MRVARRFAGPIAPSLRHDRQVDSASAALGRAA